MSNIGPSFVAIVGAVIGLAIVAVLVSQKAQTSTVLQSGGSALASIIGAAVAPVSQNNNFGSAGGGTGGITG